MHQIIQKLEAIRELAQHSSSTEMASSLYTIGELATDLLIHVTLMLHLRSVIVVAPGVDDLIQQALDDLHQEGEPNEYAKRINNV